MKQLKLITVFAASLFFSACSQKPIKYQPISEIPEGPGLLTGKDGSFKLYDSAKQKKAAEQKRLDQEIEQREYQSFKDWKASQESQEYQEFKAWQKSKANKAQQQQESINSSKSPLDAI